MTRARWWVFGCVVCGCHPASTSDTSAPPARTADASSVCARVARQLRDHATAYPQLAEFDPTRHVQENGAECQLSYHYHASRRVPEGGVRGGWRGAAPTPDADGLWILLELWDERVPGASLAQSRSQPAGPRRYVGDLRLGWLMLEGSDTRSVRPLIEAELAKHGLREAPL